MTGIDDNRPHNTEKTKKSIPNPDIGRYNNLEKSIKPLKLGLVAFNRLEKAVTNGKSNNSQIEKVIVHQIIEPIIPIKIILGIFFLTKNTRSNKTPTQKPTRILYGPAIPPNRGVGMEINPKIVR